MPNLSFSCAVHLNILDEIRKKWVFLADYNTAGEAGYSHALFPLWEKLQVSGSYGTELYHKVYMVPDLGGRVMWVK